MKYTSVDNARWTLTTPFPTPVEPIQKPRKEKPSNWGTITNRYNRNPYPTSFTYAEACLRIGNGAVWIATILNGNKCDANFVSSKYVAVDFEEDTKINRAPPNLQAELNKANENGIPPLFYYLTFSHTEEKPRFRFVWELDEPITDANQYRAILTYLIRLFNGDGACKDASRFWAGGHSLQIAETPFVSSAATFVEKANEILESPYIYKEPSRKSKKDSTSGAPRTKTRIDYNILSSRCELWHKVIDLRGNEAYWASYSDIQHLALSAYSFEGGEKRIKTAIKENPHYYNNDKHSTKYYLNAISEFKKQEHEERCSPETCPFYDKCGHIGFISDKVNAKTKTKSLYDSTHHISLLEGQRRFFAAFDEAIKATFKGIWFIRASVGLGKTYVLQDYNFSGRRVMIALPTHDLMAEYKKRFTGSVFNIIYQEQVEYSQEDIKEMNRYRRAGLSYKAKSINNTDNHKLFSDECDIAIMTQAFFMEHSEKLIPHYDTFIFDEDIKDRFYHTEQVSLPELKRDIYELYENDIISNEDMPAIKEWLKSVERKGQNTILPPMPHATVVSAALIEKKIIPCFDIWALMREDSTIVKGVVGGNANIAYTTKREVPPIKMIVLSATVDKHAHEHLFDGHIVNFTEIPPIRIEGSIEFDTEETYSISSIGNRSVKTIMKGLAERNPDFFAEPFVVIPHKRYAAEVKKLGYECRDGFHLGNTEGKDELNGRNILVLGKYSPPMNIVISLALAANPKEYDISNSYRTVRRAGYEMSFYSFAEDILNTLYLHLIDSETVQCIGRARLIWNECKVLVAGLPVEI